MFLINGFRQGAKTIGRVIDVFSDFQKFDKTRRIMGKIFAEYEIYEYETLSSTPEGLKQIDERITMKLVNWLIDQRKMMANIDSVLEAAESDLNKISNISSYTSLRDYYIRLIRLLPNDSYFDRGTIIMNIGDNYLDNMIRRSAYILNIPTVSDTNMLAEQVLQRLEEISETLMFAISLTSSLFNQMPSEMQTRQMFLLRDKNDSLPQKILGFEAPQSATES